MSDLYCPAVTIRKDYVSAYTVWMGKSSSKIRLPTSNRRKENLSKKATKRLQIALELLAQSAKTKRLWWPEEKRYISYKLNFCTLTLPSKQIHSDRVIVSTCLRKFLRWWKDRCPTLLYLWKAEVQDNGNIHFHVTSNSFIHHRVLRRKWNQFVEVLGYVSRYGKEEPPSTEVKAVKNVKDICAYIAAYISKKDLYKSNLKRYFRIYGKRILKSKEEVFHLPKNYLNSLKRKVTCPIWDASEAIQRGPLRIISPENEITQELQKFPRIEPFYKELERCIIYVSKLAPPEEIPNIKKHYREYVNELSKMSEKATAIMH